MVRVFLDSFQQIWNIAESIQLPAVPRRPYADEAVTG
jgi:hypothetical protein